MPEHQWKFSTKRCGESIRQLLSAVGHEAPFLNGLLGSYLTGRVGGYNGALFRTGICAPISCLRTPKVDKYNRPVGESPKYTLLKSLPHTPSDSSAIGSCVSIADFVDAGGQFSPESLGVRLLDPGQPGAGFALEYRDGSRCQGITTAGTAKFRKTTLEVHCDRSAALPRLMQIREGTDKGICTYRVQVAAFAACATPQGSPAVTPPPIQSPSKGNTPSEAGGPGTDAPLGSPPSAATSSSSRKYSAPAAGAIDHSARQTPPAQASSTQPHHLQNTPISLKGISGCDVPLHDGQMRALEDPRGPLGQQGPRAAQGARTQPNSGQQLGQQSGNGYSANRKNKPPQPPIGFVDDIRRCPTGGGAKIRLHGEFSLGVRLSSLHIGGQQATGCERSVAGTFTCTIPPGFGEGNDLRANFVDDRTIARGRSTGYGAPSSGTSAQRAAAGTEPRMPVKRIHNLKLERAVSYELRFNPFDFDARSELGVGGLDKEISELFRRLFASRAIPRHTLRAMGASHVKGALLYGPPGVGKTLLARRLADYLQSSSVRFVAGPEILSKYVGASEGNVRALFAPAEQEWAAKGEASGLHVIIIDEMDALCTRRSGAGEENSPAQHLYDGVVDQILAKMDGLSEQDNVLVLGLTNRKDVIDPALLRPGRFEVHVRIGYPDEAGRRDILEVHTEKMKSQGVMASDVNLGAIARAAEGCSGADVAGIVRDASGRAMERSFRRVIDMASRTASGGGAPAGLSTRGLTVTRSDFEAAVADSREECQQHEREASTESDGSERGVMTPHEIKKHMQPGGLLAAKPVRRALAQAAYFVASSWGVHPVEPQPDHSGARLTHTLSGGGSRKMTLAPGHVSGQPPKPRGYAGVSLLLHGPRRSGKSAIASELAHYFATEGGSPQDRRARRRHAGPVAQRLDGKGSPDKQEPRIRVVTPDELLELPQSQRSQALLEIVSMAKRRTDPSPATSMSSVSSSEGLKASVVLLEDVDRILELVSAGGGSVQAAHQTLHTVSTILASIDQPTRAGQKRMQDNTAGQSGWAGRFLLVATTSRPELLSGVGVLRQFSKRVEMPLLGPWSSARSLRDLGVILRSDPGSLVSARPRSAVSRPRVGSRDDYDEIDGIAGLLGRDWSCAVGDVLRIASHIHWMARHSGPQDQHVYFDRSISVSYADPIVLDEALDLLGLYRQDRPFGLPVYAEIDSDGKVLRD